MMIGGAGSSSITEVRCWMICGTVTSVIGVGSAFKRLDLHLEAGVGGGEHAEAALARSA